MSCKINAWSSPGKPSELREVLLNVAKSELESGTQDGHIAVLGIQDLSKEEQIEKIAESWYALTKSDQFINSFGDWIGDFKADRTETTPDYTGRVHDTTNEPLLVLNKKYNKYEYTGRYGEKVQFPPSFYTLESLGSKATVRNIAKTMAYKILKPRLSDDLNSFITGEMSGTLLESIKEQLAEELADAQYNVDNKIGRAMTRNFRLSFLKLFQ